MKTLNLFLIIFASLLFIQCKNSSTENQAIVKEAAEKVAQTMGKTYNVATGSNVSWTGSKIAGVHTGTIDVTSGIVSVMNGKVTGGSFTMDISSLKNTDMEGEQAANLEGHLKSADFFDAEQYPQSTFAITKVTELSSDSLANTLVYGNLTLKDVTKEIGFKANISVDEESVKVTSPEFSINRTDFGMKYGSASFFDDLKDKAINDEVGLSISLMAN